VVLDVQVLPQEPPEAGLLHPHLFGRLGKVAIAGYHEIQQHLGALETERSRLVSSLETRALLLHSAEMTMKFQMCIASVVQKLVMTRA
jgi:hypothetical protein